MKQVLRLVAFLAALCAFPTVHAQSWTDDWLSSATSTAPGSYNTQTRGYYHGGNYSMRWPQTEDHLMSVSPPRLKFGCGGIDAFGGSLSYLDADYLVQKLQRIIQAAPTFAFQLALDEFCKQCVAAMMTAEEIADQINGIMVNDCQAAKTLVYSAKNWSDVSSQENAEASSSWNVRQSYNRNYQEVKERTESGGGRPRDDMRGTVSECPNDFRTIFLGGSVVVNVTTMLNMSQYADTLRGFIGDANVTYQDGNNIFTVEQMPACPANDLNRPDDFLTGGYQLRRLNGQCVPSNATGMVGRIQGDLTGLAASIRSGTTLTPAQRGLVDNSPLPILNIMRDAVAQNLDVEYASVLAEPLALSYGYKILDDLYQAAHNVAITANKIAQDHNATGSGNRCDAKIVQGAIDWAREKEPVIREMRQATNATLRQKLQEMSNSVLVAKSYEERNRRRQTNFASPE